MLKRHHITPENTYNLSRERAQTQIQPYRRWVGFFIYELPVGPGKRFANMKGVAGRLLGGWVVSTSGTLQDGQNERRGLFTSACPARADGAGYRRRSTLNAERRGLAAPA